MTLNNTLLSGVAASTLLLSGCFTTTNDSTKNTESKPDWHSEPIPATLDKNQSWQLIEEFSDSFNYQGKSAEFTQNWQDKYMSGWRGPGLTEWSTNNSNIANGNLVLSASRKPNSNRVNTGIVTSKQPVTYPVFIEAKIKVANQVLSSNIWLLSNDSKREMDILEIYGSDRPDHEYFALRASTNYHVFIRDPETNDIIKDLHTPKKFTLPNNEPYRLDYHTFGAYWRDAWTVDFYIDGKLVRELRRKDINDPENLGLDRPMHIIFDIEDHDWRSKKGHVATDEELADETKNKMYVDWVRVYKPVDV
ncbi:hypothetical protein C2869_07230 [Saccharobesus litoralis]|uniref:GH16 domain-containing protein n=1 Tax=Saccharobesus litoralis TaxID=2172099 RepID=A0A2S0VQ80_9ALTE|nr:family 16 glycosylhydrolase [Saccharobesus litoralis]AWB66240.1 hypothetical protein C2869_07230 [Saccharobesus litoralis]